MADNILYINVKTIKTKWLPPEVRTTRIIPIVGQLAKQINQRGGGPVLSELQKSWALMGKKVSEDRQCRPLHQSFHQSPENKWNKKNSKWTNKQTNNLRQMTIQISLNLSFPPRCLGNCNFLAPRKVFRSAEGGVKTTLPNPTEGTRTFVYHKCLEFSQTGSANNHVHVMCF